jgi:hypothetical protein
LLLLMSGINRFENLHRAQAEILPVSLILQDKVLRGDWGRCGGGGGENESETH